MKALIVTNGTIRSLEYLKDLIQSNDKIICADGAVRYLRAINKIPSIVVGDLDSISKDNLIWVNEHQIELIQFDSKKDNTDTEIAVDYAISNKATHITIAGGVGSRIDHSLGNIFLLKRMMDHGVMGVLDEIGVEIQLISGSIRLKWRKGETVSFIPVSEKVTGITLIGFEYPMNNETIEMGSSRCLSNVVAKDFPDVQVEEGLLIAIRNK